MQCFEDGTVKETRLSVYHTSISIILWYCAISKLVLKVKVKEYYYLLQSSCKTYFVYMILHITNYRNKKQVITQYLIFKLNFITVNWGQRNKAVCDIVTVYVYVCVNSI